MCISFSLNMRAVFFFPCLLALLAHAERSIATDENMFLKDVQDGANKFAVNLFKKTALNEPGNFISSPLSVYMALAMASYGAREVTREELLRVLQMPEQTRDGWIGTMKSIKAINHRFNELQSVDLSIGNMIFINSDASLNPGFREILEYTFNSYPEQVDFRNPLEAAENINSWSDWFTAGKINQIVSPDQFDFNTRLMLINSVYFLGKWKVPFDPENTSLLPFYVSRRASKNVPTMIRNGVFQIGALPKMGATFVVLPYQDNGYAEEATFMYIILPDRVDGLARLQYTIDSLTLEDLQRTEEYTLDLLLPKFKIESTFELKDHLAQMGIRSAFTDSANFDGMTNNNEKLKIDQVVQKAFISIDEESTEAAATTAVEMSSRMATSSFNVNRPFLVVLATQDVILFTGKVVDPSI